MTNTKEIERVRAIHRELDKRAAEKSGRGLNIRQTVSGTTLYYTAEEIAYWPQAKEQMLAALREHETMLAALWDGHMARYCFEPGPWRERRDQIDADCVDAYERGLVIFREMIDGRYCGSDLSREAEVAALTEALPMNQEARRKLIAALGAELHRPVTARFPHEARSERAMPVSNGRGL